ncbi:something about silencing protein 10 [Phlebotomus argentipes]|uniref:something about silencing protein 10 n=1 Tax=Phlebotomus argentipes TaxID=94469 RepID=UPI0028937D4E|nr:something about silencing protein 10 [Phlebotomus argentipes]
MGDKILLDSRGGGDGYDLAESDDEYGAREKQLLKKYRDAQASASESEEEGVFGLPEDDSMEDDSDFEDKTRAEKFEADSDVMSEEDDDIPDDRAWGKKKSTFYNTDFVDQDYDTYTAREEELALLEEQETRKLQQRLTKQLSDAQFSLDVFLGSDKEAQKKDDADAGPSKHQELVQFKKESPEFDALVDELLGKLDESANIMQPFLDELKSQNLTVLPIFEFIDTRNKLSLHYATNLSFYLMLKHKRVSVKNHPVMKRIAQFRELLQQLEEKYQDEAQTAMEKVLLDIRSGKIVAPPRVQEAEKPRKMLGILKKIPEKVKEVQVSEEEDAVSASEEEQPDEEEEDDTDKRAITYQMSKNKGLIPHRKKELRNPRVKHRLKYKKALVRRKGAVRTVRKEEKRYTGEHSGIKATVRKSIKIR